MSQEDLNPPTEQEIAEEADIIELSQEERALLAQLRMVREKAAGKSESPEAVAELGVATEKLRDTVAHLEEVVDALPQPNLELQRKYREREVSIKEIRRKLALVQTVNKILMGVAVLGTAPTVAGVGAMGASVFGTMSKDNAHALAFAGLGASIVIEALVVKTQSILLNVKQKLVN